VSSLDFLPTFCGLAGTTPPSDLALDGVDLRPLVKGDPIDRKKPLVWAYFNALNDARVAMRDGKWKVLAKLNGGSVAKMTNVTSETLPLIRDAELTDIEVYDITSDIEEGKNLAASKPELARELGDKLREHYHELVTHSHTW
jgi:arylsulfatase A